MDFSACVYDVICTRKNNIDWDGSLGQYRYFLVHIISGTSAEKAIIN